jgi:hypothetical protein
VSCLFRPKICFFRDPSTENFEWPSYSNDTEHYVSLDLPPRLIRGALHFPDSDFWNTEAILLAKYTLSDSPLHEREIVSDLSTEERLQLSAYKRAWLVLWLFVIAVAIVIWVLIICFVFTKGKAPSSKPYSNLVINR